MTLAALASPKGSDSTLSPAASPHGTQGEGVEVRGQGVTSDGVQCLMVAPGAGLAGHGRPLCRAELWTALDCGQG